MCTNFPCYSFSSCCYSLLHFLCIMSLSSFGQYMAPQSVDHCIYKSSCQHFVFLIYYLSSQKKKKKKINLGEESRVKILSEYWRRCFNSIRFIIDLSSSVLKFSYLSSGKLQPVLGLILVNTGDCLIPVLCTSNSKLSFILIISVDLDGTVISILACHIHSVSYSTLFIPQYLMFDGINQLNKILIPIGY